MRQLLDWYLDYHWDNFHKKTKLSGSIQSTIAVIELFQVPLLQRFEKMIKLWKMPYNLKVFQIIKTLVCTFCFHLLKIVGCIEQTSILSLLIRNYDPNLYELRPKYLLLITPKTKIVQSQCLLSKRG